MKAYILAAMLAAVTVTATAARADDDADQRADLRCFLGMTVMAKNETYKEWAQFGIFFYTGRLKGRDPKVDIGEGLKREFMTLRTLGMNEEIRRCSDQLGQVSRDLESLKRDVPRGVGR